MFLMTYIFLFTSLKKGIGNGNTPNNANGNFNNHWNFNMAAAAAAAALTGQQPGFSNFNSTTTNTNNNNNNNNNVNTGFENLINNLGGSNNSNYMLQQQQQQQQQQQYGNSNSSYMAAIGSSSSTGNLLDMSGGQLNALADTGKVYGGGGGGGGGGANAPPSNTIYVYGIGQQANESDLYSLFNNCGRILRVNVIKNSKTGLCKGFGFVVFDTIEEANFAVHTMNGYIYHNRPLQVNRIFFQFKININSLFY